MADRSSIEWTESTWSPIRARNLATGKVGWHCEHASEGCRNCYSEAFNHKRLGTGLPFKPGHRADVDVFLDEKMLLQPLRWRRPRRVFVCSMTDLFADFVPDAMIDHVFAVMALCPQHTFQVLTKRPERMRAWVEARAKPDEAGQPAEDVRVAMTTLASTPSRREMAPALKAIPLGKYCKAGPWPLPNVWLGSSCEDQAAADARVPVLLATPAAVRFVSAEPLLGPIDFTKIVLRRDGQAPTSLSQQLGDYVQPLSGCLTDSPRLAWIIVGGESGPQARPTHPQWDRDIRDQCAAAGVAFFKKQNGEFRAVGPIFGAEPVLDVDERRCAIVCLDGSIWPDDAGQPPSGAWMMERVGKRRAGRLLDGRTHDAMPEVRHG